VTWLAKSVVENKKVSLDCRAPVRVQVGCRFLIFVDRLELWLSSYYLPAISSDTNLKVYLIYIDVLSEISTIPLSFFLHHFPLTFLFPILSHGTRWERNTCRLAWQRYFLTVRSLTFYIPASFDKGFSWMGI
jgi:hypothetical protein